MKKYVICAIIIIAAIVGGIFYTTKTGGNSSSGHSSGSSGPGGYTFAKAEPITVTGVGGYQLGSVDLGEGPVPLITIPLDTWGGYAALITANNGLKPNKDSLFYKKGKFAVELVNEESASKQLQGYASGRWPIIWAPMDSLPILSDGLNADKRIKPKVLGLFDWSVGGDGIIVKNSIRNPQDLKDKIILTSSNTPYSFMLLWYLAQINLTGNDVKVVWVDDGDKALEMFKKDKNIVAWVSWTPYINDVVNSASPNYVPDTRLLISSKDATQLIADTFIVRADLFADKPEMLQTLVECVIEGSQTINTKTYSDMAEFYKISVGEAKDMMKDVHIANFPESQMFLDENNPIGAYKIFFLAEEYYKQLGCIPTTASMEPDGVISHKIFDSIEQKKIFANQKNMMIDSFNKKASFDLSDLENQREILANDLQLYFEPQKVDFDIKSDDPSIVQNMKLLKNVADQAKILGTSAIKLVGNLDTAKVKDLKAQGQATYSEAASQAKIASKKRAEFIKQILVTKYGIEEERIKTVGMGWDNPIMNPDGTPAEAEKNRRVEVKFISLE